MGRPDFTMRDGGLSALPEVREAEAALDRLAAGGSLGAGEKAQMQEVFVGQLWSGAPGAASRAHQALSVLFEASDPVGRVGLLGDVASTGERGRPVFDQIAREMGGGLLSEAEIDALSESLSAAPQEQVRLVAGWLEEEAARRGRAPAAPYPRTDIDRPRRLDPAPPQGQAAVEGGRDDDPRDTLTNPDLPEEERHAAARSLGVAAIPYLIEMAKGGDREIAQVALVEIGRTPEGERMVWEAAQALESDPGLRSLGERVRGAVEDPVARHPPLFGNDAARPGGWLSRALESCDSSNILQASAGREALAVRLALRALAERRQLRRDAPPAGL